MKIPDDLQNELDRFMMEKNHTGIADFEGYSPAEIQYILYDPFSPNSPIQLKNLSSDDFAEIPIFMKIKHLMKKMDEEGGIKLTPKGNLPMKMVKEVYEIGGIEDYWIASGYSTQLREEKVTAVHLPKIILQISGMVKKRHNKWTLTKEGEKLLKNDQKLLLRILKIFCTKYNWAYLDGYGENNIGRFGFAFTLILMNKYGEIKRSAHYYAEKYFKAFPQLFDELIPESYSNIETRAYNCYSIRSFDRFLHYFGLIDLYEERKYPDPQEIKKTKLFNKWIKIVPHIPLAGFNSKKNPKQGFA